MSCMGLIIILFNGRCFILFCSFPLHFAFVVGGLGFELCVFVAGWRHALRSEWPFIIIIINGRHNNSSTYNCQHDMNIKQSFIWNCYWYIILFFPAPMGWSGAMTQNPVKYGVMHRAAMVLYRSPARPLHLHARTLSQTRSMDAYRADSESSTRTTPLRSV